MQTMTAVDQSKWEPTLQMSTDVYLHIQKEKISNTMRYKANYDECIKRK